jgi:hypothetical protein
MPSLDQFDFDLFISYGWAGIRTPNDADRGWVKEFKLQLESQLSGALGRLARVYLDVEQSLNGELPANLQSAVSSSALFLSVISPGSCRRESWCRFELETFVTGTGSLLPHAGQLLSILMRETPRQQWPEPLQAIVPREFLTASEPRLTLPREELGRMDTPTGKLVQTMALDMAKALEALEDQIARTVFIADGPPALAARADRLAIEIDGRGGAVFRNALAPGQSEEDFTARTRRALRRSGLSVHLLTGKADPAPAGWSDSPQGLQISEAAARFRSERNRMILWHEGEQVTGIQAGATSSAQVLQGTGFEDFESLVRNSLCASVAIGESRTEAGLEQAAAAGAGAGGGGRPSGPQFVYVECVKQDLPKLERLRALLEQKGIHIQRPLFQGDEALLRRANEELLKNDSFQRRCRAAAVYYGSRNDLEAYVACRLLDDSLHDRRPELPMAILLDPYDDPVHSYFSYPDFEAFPCSRLEEFVQQILGGN